MLGEILVYFLFVLQPHTPITLTNNNNNKGDIQGVEGRCEFSWSGPPGSKPQQQQDNMSPCSSSGTTMELHGST